MTAALFFDRQPKALQGEALVVCNSLVALVMVVVAVRGIGVLGVEVRDLQLTFVDDRSVVQLPPLDDSFATHVYMSRQHANAQEQSSVIKGLLVTMLPTCKVYLNEDDDDDDGDVEDLVHEASTFMAVLTTQYLCSRKCMLGLLTAWRLGKPIVVLREADVRYGGLSARGFAEEVALYVARYGKGMSEEEHASIAWLESAAAEGLEWHRGKQLKHAVLCSLAELIYHNCGGDATRDGVTWGVRASITALGASLRQLPSPRQPRAPRTTRLQANSPGCSTAVAPTQIHLGLTSPTLTAEGATPTPTPTPTPTATVSVEAGAATLREAVGRNGRRLADMFKAYGEGGGGQVTKSEFRKAIPLIGVKASRVEIDALFDEVDADQRGTIGAAVLMAFFDTPTMDGGRSPSKEGPQSNEAPLPGREALPPAPAEDGVKEPMGRLATAAAQRAEAGANPNPSPNPNQRAEAAIRESSTYSVELTRTPMGLGLSLTKDVVTEIKPDSQAAQS